MKINLLIILVLASFQSVDAYNFRYKASRSNAQNSRDQKTLSNKRGIKKYNNSNFSRQKPTSSFGFEVFNETEKKLKAPKYTSQTRRMGRGPQKRINPKNILKREKKRNTRSKRKIENIKAVGYTGEFYGGGNSLFEVDPGLVNRWNKPGLILSKTKKW
ncbi:MAG: hypothetical protein COB02_12415 [Candidatus Cloacimonadota bacterium]|nr:MAG: hypothetical protein COB02_12415 [Candidatus Cloacimonadota bacterium]